MLIIVGIVCSFWVLEISSELSSLDFMPQPTAVGPMQKNREMNVLACSSRGLVSIVVWM
jgi:hypothetical protein